MKRLKWMGRLLLIFCTVLPATYSAEVIARWDFNSPEGGDSDVATGSFSPQLGSADFTVIGGASSSFGSVGGGKTSDGASEDNSQLRMTSFPPRDAANRSTGVQIAASTVGFKNISLHWDQYNSATASRYWRVQYSTNGVDWVDKDAIANSAASAWSLDRTVSFADEPLANDNPNFMVRIVSEFESSALGVGAETYVAVKDGSNYSTAGTLWMDSVVLTGTPVDEAPLNTAPTVSQLADVQSFRNAPLNPIQVSIDDAETPAFQLSVTTICSNPELVPAGGLALEGFGSERMLTIRPFTNVLGSATITIVVSDGEFVSSSSFRLTVMPETVVARWRFDSVTPDADPKTGTMEAVEGPGTLTAFGEVSESFGTVGGGSGGTENPEDDSMLRLASFPAQGTGNKSAGIEIRCNTGGKSGLALAWDQYNSSSASAFWRIQLTTNGTDFSDFAVITNSAASTWLTNLLVDLSGVPGIENNRRFGLRLVPEFESTATGGGEEAFRPVDPSSNYSRAGTLWLDNVRLFGDTSESQNTTPTCSEIPDLAVDENGSVGPISFSIDDSESDPENLEITVTTSRPEILTNIVVAGFGGERTLLLVPEPGQSGDVTLTVLVTDEGGATATRSFNVRVIQQNTTPVISKLTDITLARNASSEPILFSIQDREQAAERLSIALSSSNPELLDETSFDLRGDVLERSLVITPKTNRIGSTAVRIAVSDGSLTSEATFEVQVIPTNYFTFWDFNQSYDGSGTLNASFGEGTATGIGGVITSTGTVGGGVTSDGDAGNENRMLRVTGFPSIDSGNKSAGIEFHINTTGYEHLAVLWDQYNSGSASRFWRFQISTNGADFVDSIVETNANASIWRKHRIADLSDVPGLANNPDAAFRLVSEFESSATGSGLDAYLPVEFEAGNYSASGTLWLDYVAVSGDPVEISEPVEPAEPVVLSVSSVGGSIRISWPTTARSGILQSVRSFYESWAPVEIAPVDDGENLSVTIETSDTAAYFRLVQPNNAALGQGFPP